MTYMHLVSALNYMLSESGKLPHASQKDLVHEASVN